VYFFAQKTKTVCKFV